MVCSGRDSNVFWLNRDSNVAVLYYNFISIEIGCVILQIGILMTLILYAMFLRLIQTNSN